MSHHDLITIVLVFGVWFSVPAFLFILSAFSLKMARVLDRIGNWMPHTLLWIWPCFVPLLVVYPITLAIIKIEKWRQARIDMLKAEEYHQQREQEIAEKKQQRAKEAAAQHL